jgi:hypothetical protein
MALIIDKDAEVIERGSMRTVEARQRGQPYQCTNGAKLPETSDKRADVPNTSYYRHTGFKCRNLDPGSCAIF